MKEDFKPYIPADRVESEISVSSILFGVFLAVLFGAANAYLGLRVGMTVSASIPAAVISMGIYRVLRKFFKRNTILDSNMVQTVGSAGESLAAGAIFTMPALFLWAKEGVTESPSMFTIAAIALCGGLLGVLFMVPLRKALIVKEHGVLPYPEGTACAEVLLAGEQGGASATTVFAGMGLASLFKFVVDGLKVIPGIVTAPIKALKTELSTQVYPALIGVGYICGPKISSYMLAGGLIGWFVTIPAIITFGGETILYPGTDTIANMYAAGGASAIWSSYIRYIGAGAVAAGGIISLIKSMPLIVTTFIDAIKGLKDGGKGNGLRTDKDMDIRIIIGGILAIAVVIWLLPQIPVNLLGALLIVVFGFFFGAVSSRMVGIVGSSNNPVSGMAIATLLIATIALKSTGETGAEGMMGAIAIGSVICIIAAMAGDTSQDLKTGYILGATPVKQQIGELIGAVVSAIAIGGVLVVLDKAWGFGSAEISAPQATLMKMIVEGVMDGNLPWALVFIGVFIAIVIEILGISVLPVAIGLYLPLELSTTIMIGGIIRWFVDKKNKNAEKNQDASAGILFCSGMIAGEGLVGILLAILTVAGFADKFDLSGKLNTGIVGGVLLLILMILCVLKFAFGKKEKMNEKA
ncbi:MAG: oligopeptide transporter, OPT family [Lachnospiraceae bacterium]|nr:oligopeptide transporter, OPT family [Lachnospiraceae bacterium]